MFDVLGELFDFDNDGSLDITERAAELGFIDEIIDDDEYAGEDDETDDKQWLNSLYDYQKY